MLLWSGACVVHEEFKSKALFDLKALYPDAGVLVHPESPAAVIDIADAVGSTSQILKAAAELPHQDLHRRHRSWHVPQAAPAQSGQTLHRSADGR